MQDNEKNGQKMAPQDNKRDPRDTQFKAGHPGGPGRPRGSIGLKRLIKQALWQDEGKYAKEIAEHAVKEARYFLPWLKFLMEQLDELKVNEESLATG